MVFIFIINVMIEINCDGFDPKRDEFESLFDLQIYDDDRWGRVLFDLQIYDDDDIGEGRSLVGLQS